MSDETTKPRKAADKSARTRSREFALQALYQHLVGRNEADAIDTFTRDLTGFHKADSVHYDALLHGCIAQAQALDELIVPLLDRPLAEISPIEHAVQITEMVQGTYASHFAEGRRLPLPLADRQHPLSGS